jgi:hypothetical protein
MFIFNILLSVIVPVGLIATIAIIGEQRNERRISARNMKFAPKTAE